MLPRREARGTHEASQSICTKCIHPDPSDVLVGIANAQTIDGEPQLLLFLPRCHSNNFLLWTKYAATNRCTHTSNKSAKNNLMSMPRRQHLVEIRNNNTCSVSTKTRTPTRWKLLAFGLSSLAAMLCTQFLQPAHSMSPTPGFWMADVFRGTFFWPQPMADFHHLLIYLPWVSLSKSNQFVQRCQMRFLILIVFDEIHPLGMTWLLRKEIVH